MNKHTNKDYKKARAMIYRWVIKNDILVSDNDIKALAESFARSFYKERAGVITELKRKIKEKKDGK